MSNCFNCQNQSIPAYSGITINITNPVMNATCPQNYSAEVVNSGVKTLPLNEDFAQNQIYTSNPSVGISPNGYYSQAEIARNNFESQKYNGTETNQYDGYTTQSLESNDAFSSQENAAVNREALETSTYTTTAQTSDWTSEASAYETASEKTNDRASEASVDETESAKASDKTSEANAYETESAQENDRAEEKINSDDSQTISANENIKDNSGYNTSASYAPENKDVTPTENQQENYAAKNDVTTQPQAYDKTKDNASPSEYGKDNSEDDLSVSKEIIEELDSKNAEMKELEKNGKEVKVVALTNEYIMSLENYLNNPNTDIRLMASKEVLTRLDEDHERYDDAALNALLNKMLQDPSKLIRVAALSALSSNLASGNNYTIELLNRIQQNPDSDKQDVLDAAQILLNRTAKTEARYVRQDNERAKE